jgi:hypothetical protein
MRKILVCCSAIAMLALASPAAYAGGPDKKKGHKGGKGGTHQNHTCQGGHNCNVTVTPGRPVVSPPAPAPAPAPPAPSSSDSSSTSTSTSNSTSTVNVGINVNAQSAPVAAPCPGACPAPPAAAPPVATVKRCKTIRVKRYRKVWHTGRNRCGDLVRWYTYKKVRVKRRVCV